MKISIITACYNAEKTLNSTIESVLKQRYNNVEYIIVDGQSKDNTIKIIESYQDKFKEKGFEYKWISEKDKGIYDAMNKGINLSTGDIVGILNADDKYSYDEVLKDVVNALNDNYDCCYGNILYIKNSKSFRYWKAGRSRPFKYGWMPPHPTFFVRRYIYEKYGLFRLDCGVNADYELILRFLEINKIKSVWINKIMVYMNAGGQSNNGLKSRLEGIANDKKAWLLNNIKPSLVTIILKRIRKIPQYLTAKFIKI